MNEIAADFYARLPEFSTAGLVVFFFFLTFVTEDGACLLAGTAVANGRLGLGLAIAACMLGIFAGDVLLYGAGRAIGPRVFENRFVRRFVSDASRAKASAWLTRNAGFAVFASRFATGLRLPTYLAAGALRTGFAKFTFWFLLAAAVWTPILVGSATYAQVYLFRGSFIVGIVVLAILLRLVFALRTHRGRRLFVGRLKRIVNWEFWPLQIFYAPVVVYVAWLAVRFRGLTIFTAVNPAIPAGGFKGESKEEIYRGLENSPNAAPFMLRRLHLPATIEAPQRIAAAREFVERESLSFPVVLKPDAGERGKDVAIVESLQQLEMLLCEIDGAAVIQEFADGVEISVFYHRSPAESSGHVFSITEKRFPYVVGDGKKTLERLILDDSRAVCLAEKYFAQNQSRLDEIINEGEIAPIAHLGTHSRGAIFLDGEHLRTPELETAIDAICVGYDGFHFGRFDLRAPSFDDFRRGENFRIVELNGVTSESTNIYDPRFTLVDAYKILFRQWRIAFEIGAENLFRGSRPTSVADLVRLIFGRPAATIGD